MASEPPIRMARPKKQIELRVPDLASLSPEQRDWLDGRIADALQFIMTFPLENNDDETRKETARRSERAKQVPGTPRQHMDAGQELIGGADRESIVSELAKREAKVGMFAGGARRWARS